MIKDDDLDKMKWDDTKPNARKKVMSIDYSLGKRIWEKEQCFNDAVKHGDHHHAEYYDRQIKKLYKESGIDEGKY